MNQLEKNKIESAFQNYDIELVETLLHEISLVHPYDRDYYFYECVYFIMTQQYEQAQNILSYCIRKFPTSYECYYYQASLYQAQNMVLPALKNYIICKFLCGHFMIKDEEIEKDTANQIAVLIPQLEELVKQYIEKNDMINLLKVSSFQELQKTFWGRIDHATRNPDDLIIGKERWVSDKELRYIGIYRNPAYHLFDETTSMSLVHTQGEILKICKQGIDFYVEGDADEFLVPIAADSPFTVHGIQNNEKTYIISQSQAKSFNYYRVKRNTCIYSSSKAYYGNPIPLGHHPKRKKLVLSFFVDGLSQEIIQGSRFKELMPNTYQFFLKGMVCTQAYSTAEWTYPSLAAYQTGLDTLNHMLFHKAINSELPHDFPTLFEYFKRQGYYTSKIDGDWRSSYPNGYTRGIDQYVYQHQNMGGRAEQEIMNVIEHLEAFKDTDQYLWMCVGDLHDIADEFGLSLALQNNLPLEYRISEDKTETSVKQFYSEAKSKTYEKMVTYLDMLFGFLYSYIENNYTDDEMVISLFADHGQGYLVPQGKPFLSKERSHVAFMFRSGDLKPGVTNEIISTTDYLPIMCRLSDISQSDVSINGQLPKAFGGECEREFAITESLHPGDPYLAVAHAKDFEIFFDNPVPTDDEGRFLLGDYSVYGFYYNGEPMEDEEILQKYEEIFLERIAEHIIYN